MKFKDLKIGDWFTREGWQTVDEKIEPVQSNNVKDGWITHREVGTGIRAGYVKDGDEVIPVEKK